jgi:hypothetical protein
VPAGDLIDGHDHLLQASRLAWLLPGSSAARAGARGVKL